MSDNSSNVIKGQAWISDNKLLQDQIIEINGVLTENTVVLISDIWDNLFNNGDSEYVVKSNKKGYFYWEIPVTPIDNDNVGQLNEKMFIECPKPREDQFERLSEVQVDEGEDVSEVWAKYWKKRFDTTMENAEKKMTIQRKEVVFGGSNYIDPDGNLKTIDEQHVQVDHELGSIANLLMMF
jgi:hypothetical protein